MGIDIHEHRRRADIPDINTIWRRTLVDVPNHNLTGRAAAIVAWRKRKWQEKLYKEEYLNGKS